MRIAVDATCWRNSRGYGRHARGLLNALVRLDKRNEYVFVLDTGEHEALPREVDKRMVRTSKPAATAAAADGRRSLSDLWQMSRALSAREFDLVFFPTVYTYVPVYTPAKKVVMIHDVIAETFPALTVPKRMSRYFWRTKVALGHWQADAIVTVSEYSRRGILKHFKTAEERVFVVGEASDPIFCVMENAQPSRRLRSLGIGASSRAVVYVGGFGPHKNLERLVNAFATIASRHEFSDVKLVFVGECQKEVFHSSLARTRERIRELGVTDRVIFTGYLDDEDLVILLNRATVLVLPSLMEGFGLPALEAAACGCPVIATKASPLPGLLKDGALYIDPTEQRELEAALERVLASEELRQQMKAAGLAAAERLSWAGAADELRHIFNRVAVQ